MGLSLCVPASKVRPNIGFRLSSNEEERKHSQEVPDSRGRTLAMVALTACHARPGHRPPNPDVCRPTPLALGPPNGSQRKTIGRSVGGAATLP